MVIVVNEVLIPLVDRVDKPLECLKAVVFIPKLLDDLLVGIAISSLSCWMICQWALPSAWVMVGGRYEAVSNLVCTW